MIFYPCERKETTYLLDIFVCSGIDYVFFFTSGPCVVYNFICLVISAYPKFFGQKTLNV